MLAGELPAARTSFRAFYALWQRFRALPELFDVKAQALLHVRSRAHMHACWHPSDVVVVVARSLTHPPHTYTQFGHDYPLRPELIESSYHLYAATRDPYYLSVGKEFLFALQVRPHLSLTTHVTHLPPLTHI